MQSRRRGGHRPAAAREHGLIAIAIVHGIAALDTAARARNRSHRSPRQRLIRRRPEADDTPAEESAFEDLRVQGMHAFKHHPGAGFQFLPRVNQRLPETWGRSPQPPDEQALHCATAGHTTADQTRRKHSRVVHDDDIAGLKQFGELADGGMGDRPGRPIEVEQSRGAALAGWFLRDQVGGKIEVEVADVHPRPMLAAIGQLSARLSAIAEAESR